MIQNIIVFIIVGVAAFLAIKRIYKTVYKSRDSQACGSCCSQGSCDTDTCKE